MYKNDNPYNWMTEQAVRQLNVYGVTIVCMRLDGIQLNEILEYDPVNNTWIWQNDWYEGQHEIEFLWAAPLNEVVKK